MNMWQTQYVKLGGRGFYTMVNKGEEGGYLTSNQRKKTKLFAKKSCDIKVNLFYMITINNVCLMSLCVLMYSLLYIKKINILYFYV